MVFPSIPAYLDPSNWQPQAEHFHPRSSTTRTSHLLPPPPPPPPPQPNHQSNGGGGSKGPTGSIRPGSMVDRARMANIPLPEAALKCPRCESTNTKFCYFNNYSLSQPRHFCKACKRYWTRGGALRSVPVGGGCRRNKRSSSKGTRSKSPVSSDRAQTGSANSSGSISSHGGVGHIDHTIGLGQQNPPLRFMAPLHHLTDFNAMASSIGLNYGLDYSGLSAAMSGLASSGDHLNFQLGGGGSLLGMEQWPLQQPLQFPFMSGLEAASTGLFEGGGEAGYGGQTSRLKPGSLDVSQVAGNSVKMEESQDQVNLGRQLLGINSGSNGGNQQQQQQYNWVGANSNAWSDFLGFSSSSMATRNQL